MADPVSLAITVAINAANMAMTMMNKIEGPRLDDLSVTTADYGTPLAQFVGTKRLECPCIYAEKIREEKHKSKGKTGKYAEYKYFGTWAVFIADHEIEQVLKIFLDRRLVYDRTGTGPVTVKINFTDGHFGVDGLKVGDNCRIYLGTETQEPDPRMLAKIEAKEGAGHCSALLGVAYMMFEEFPLEKFGNRLPQVSVVAMRAPPLGLYPFESHEGGLSLGVSGLFWGSMTQFTPDFRKLVIIKFDGIEIWDVANRTRVYAGLVEHEISETVGVTNEGTIYTISLVDSVFGLWLLSPYGGATFITDRFDLLQGGCEYVAGTVYCYFTHYLVPGYGYLTTDAIGYKFAAVPTTYIVTHITADANNELLIFGCDPPNNIVSINDVPVATVTSGNAAGFDTGNDSYCVAQAGNLYLVDKLTMTVTHTATGVYNAANTAIYAIMKNCRPGMGFIWIKTKQYSTTDLTLMQTVDISNWTAAAIQDFRYDPINDALIGAELFDVRLDWLFLNRAAANSFVLGDLCALVADQAGMSPVDYDFGLLDQAVPGYSWTQGAAKDVLSALLDIYDCDIAPHGFQQRGIPRGRVLAGPPITPEWMVRNEDGPLYRIPITSETDLPRRVFATFADPEMDEQPNTAIVQRNANSVKTDRESNYDLSTLQIHRDDLQPMLERALRRAWIGSTKPEFAASPLEIRIEPGDVRHLVLENDEVLRCRNTRANLRANRVVDTEWEVDGETQADIPDWELDDASPLNQLYNSPGGFTNGRPPDVILFPGETKGFVLDTPLFSDADELAAPFVYLGASPEFESSFWPGGGLWASDVDNIDFYEAGFDSFTTDQQVTWGVCTDPLPDAATDTWDYGSELDVYMPAGGQLESITEDEALANQLLNMAVVGNEIVQFLDAVEVETNRWLITGFIRGARGTEYAVADHQNGERFVLVGSGIKKHIMGASEIGDTDYYKFSTLGDDLGAVETIALEFAANAHRPLSPVHVDLQRQSDNDWLITWQRRTRIGGSTINGQDVPLGETTERYRVKIMDGEDVVETYEVSEEQKLYTAAEQNVDWGSAQTALTVEVCQMSTALNLEGFATEASA